MCNFNKLALTNHGYVVCCSDCGYYQLAFGTTLLTLSEEDFNALIQTVSAQVKKMGDCDTACFSDDSKNIIVSAPSNQCCFILTCNELKLFYEMLDNADNEIKAISLLKLFK